MAIDNPYRGSLASVRSLRDKLRAELADAEATLAAERTNVQKARARYEASSQSIWSGPPGRPTVHERARRDRRTAFLWPFFFFLVVGILARLAERGP